MTEKPKDLIHVEVKIDTKDDSIKFSDFLKLLKSTQVLLDEAGKKVGIPKGTIDWTISDLKIEKDKPENKQ